MKNIMAVEFRF